MHFFRAAHLRMMHSPGLGRASIPVGGGETQFPQWNNRADAMTSSVT